MYPLVVTTFHTFMPHLYAFPRRHCLNKSLPRYVSFVHSIVLTELLIPTDENLPFRTSKSNFNFNSLPSFGCFSSLFKQWQKLRSHCNLSLSMMLGMIWVIVSKTLSISSSVVAFSVKKCSPSSNLMGLQIMLCVSINFTKHKTKHFVRDGMSIAIDYIIFRSSSYFFSTSP